MVAIFKYNEMTSNDISFFRIRFYTLANLLVDIKNWFLANLDD